jgi:hypothetical protein
MRILFMAALLSANQKLGNHAIKHAASDKLTARGRSLVAWLACNYPLLTPQ